MTDTPHRGLKSRITLFFAAMVGPAAFLLSMMLATIVLVSPRSLPASEWSTLKPLHYTVNVGLLGRTLPEPAWRSIAREFAPQLELFRLEANLGSAGFKMHDGSLTREQMELALRTHLAGLGVSNVYVGSIPNYYDRATRQVSEGMQVIEPADLARALALGSCLSLGVLALLCWAYRRRLDSARAFGWRRGAGWLLATLAAIYASNALLSILLAPGQDVLDRYLDTYRALLEELPLWASAAFMIGLAPLAEELAFRKWMLSLLPRAIGNVAAIVVGSSLFVAVHFPDSLWHAGMLASASLGFALLWMRSRSLLLCWSAHAAFNTVGYFAMRSIL
jgi:membrane protease YdiL (CAAX protease family)